MRFVVAPTAVEARFDSKGQARPRRFTWNGAWVDITDVGRQWVNSDGRHVLVMVGGRHTFELLLERESLAWRVVRAPKELGMA